MKKMRGMLQKANPFPTIEPKKLSTSTEPKRIPIYYKHTVCSAIYAQSKKRQPSSEKIKPTRRSIDMCSTSSKVTPIRQRMNEKNVTSLYTKTMSSTKNSKGVADKIVKSKKQMKQPTKGIESKPAVIEKKPILSQECTISVVNNDSILEECNEQHSVVESVSEELQNEGLVQEVRVGSNVVEHEKEKEIKEEVPKEEESKSEMLVNNQQVVTLGKKDAAACINVREEAIKLREQRMNRVKALVGAFETVISHESDVSPKKSFHFNKKLTL